MRASSRSDRRPRPRPAAVSADTGPWGAPRPHTYVDLFIIQPGTGPSSSPHHTTPSSAGPWRDFQSPHHRLPRPGHRYYPIVTSPLFSHLSRMIRAQIPGEIPLRETIIYSSPSSLVHRAVIASAFGRFHSPIYPLVTLGASSRHLTQVKVISRRRAPT